MSGTLGLSTPWARGKVREPLRSELEALIPDGYTIGVSVAANHGKVRVWVNTPTEVAVYDRMRWHAEDAIRLAIAWIEEHDTATYAGVEVPVR